MKSIHRAAAVALACALLGTGSLALADTQIVGAGSTFDNPFFSRAFFQYKSDHPDVTVNYQSIGSGGGIQQFTARTVDFGASDVPLNPTEMKAAKDSNGAVVEFPVTLGGVAIAYNVSGAPHTCTSHRASWRTSSSGRSASGTTRRSRRSTRVRTSRTCRSSSSTARTRAERRTSSPTI